ncbi:MAG: hypothetical protein NTX22_06890 [Ignavibacteriales bacterium]|nr:hypothetical protein [Ignavibacteriales bacterium]
MKKGCFIILLVVLTVIISVIIYIFKNHKNDVIGIFKPVIISSVESELSKKIDSVKNSIYKDSLKSIIADYMILIKKRKDFSMDKAGNYFDQVKFALMDGKIDSIEIKNLKTLMKEDFNTNERPKKNRN